MLVEITAAYVAVGLVLGWAWIATDFRVRPHRDLVPDFVAAVLGWPFFAIFIIALALATRSKKDRADGVEQGGRIAQAARSSRTVRRS